MMSASKQFSTFSSVRDHAVRGAPGIVIDGQYFIELSAGVELATSCLLTLMAQGRASALVKGEASC